MLKFGYYSDMRIFLFQNEITKKVRNPKQVGKVASLFAGQRANELPFMIMCAILHAI